MFLYLKDKNDQTTLNKIRKKLTSLPDTAQALFRKEDKEE